MIFGDKKIKTTKAVKPLKAKTEVAQSAQATTAEIKAVLAKLSYSYRVTEKATRLGDNNTYVFNILSDKNKIQIIKDLETTYKVKVLNVNIVNSPRKKVFSRGRHGVKSGFKKAYITLKKGDSISL